jgi:hypothetical protein
MEIIQGPNCISVSDTFFYPLKSELVELSYLCFQAAENPLPVCEYSIDPGKSTKMYNVDMFHYIMEEANQRGLVGCFSIRDTCKCIYDNPVHKSRK